MAEQPTDAAIQDDLVSSAMTLLGKALKSGSREEQLMAADIILTHLLDHDASLRQPKRSRYFTVPPATWGQD